MNATRLTILLAAVFACPLMVCAVEDMPKADVVKQQTKIKVGADTTYILEPLTEEGYVDYVAALNQSADVGVTVKNNFVVVLCEVIGPDEIDENIRATFFEMLEAKIPAEDGNYFQPYGEAIGAKAGINDEERDRLYELFGNAESKPWKEMDSPEVAAWLNANEKQLDKIAAAASRTKYYTPIVSSDGLVVSAWLPVLQPLRSVARGLKIRAMRDIERGKFDAAWADLQAIHRIGRLAGQAPMLIDALVALAIDEMANQGDREFLQQAELDAAGWKKRRKQIETLPPLPVMADKVNRAERFMYLDAVQMVSREGFDALAEIAGGDPGVEALKPLAKSVDWNETMRLGNTNYDKMVAAMGVKGFAAAKKAMAEHEAELESRAKELGGVQGVLKAIFSTPKARGKKVGTLLSALLVPAVSSCHQAESRRVASQDATRLCFALAAYHAEHNVYPETLAALAPEFIADIPIDRVSGEAFHFNRVGQGYLLYGYGHNQQDDQGDAELDDVIQVE